VTARRGWEKSTNGPDWTDIASLMSAIEVMHTCRVSLIVTAGSQGHNGGIHVVALAVFDRLPGSGIPKQAEAKGDFPTARTKTFDGLCYALVFELDYAIQQLYEQQLMQP